MDWMVIGCCAVMAWVTLCIVSGERLRRQQALRIERIQSGAPCTEGDPGARSRPAA